MYYKFASICNYWLKSVSRTVAQAINHITKI
jgi:hypothetical protein